MNNVVTSKEEILKTSRQLIRNQQVACSSHVSSSRKGTLHQGFLQEKA